MNVYLATEAALKEASHRTIIERACAANPQLRGAKVADILDMYDNHDAFMGFMESPYWDSADGKSFREAGTGSEYPSYFRVAGIAICLLHGNEEPDNFIAQVVELLARRARVCDLLGWRRTF